MKAKFTSTLLFLALGILLPLWDHIALWQSSQILAISLACIILLFSQPSITPSEIESERKYDRFSVLFIMAGSLICIAFTVAEWAHFRSPYHAFNMDAYTISGCVLLAGGIAFRLWAIRTLGKFFTSTVQVQDQQCVIQHGPYAFLRHPSYLGNYVAMLGCSLLLHAYIGLAVTGVIMLMAYRFRIQMEEKTLARELGEPYRVYMKRTYKMVPFVY